MTRKHQPFGPDVQISVSVMFPKPESQVMVDKLEPQCAAQQQFFLTHVRGQPQTSDQNKKSDIYDFAISCLYILRVRMLAQISAMKDVRAILQWYRKKIRKTFV